MRTDRTLEGALVNLKESVEKLGEQGGETPDAAAFKSRIQDQFKNLETLLSGLDKILYDLEHLTPRQTTDEITDIYQAVQRTMRELEAAWTKLDKGIKLRGK